MSAHTPDISLKTKRPWIVRGISTPALGVAVYGADGDCVCGGLTVADARLIASAPDLLAALQMTVDAAKHGPLESNGAWRAVARAAIAKAEGKS